MWRLLFRVTSTFPGSSCSAKQFKVLPARFSAAFGAGAEEDRWGVETRREERRGEEGEPGGLAGGGREKQI